MLALGAILDGKYRLVREIGKGGMGTVYEGVNERIDRRVAIKTMHASLARDASLVVRFEREAQAAARIGSSHIVDVLDLGDLPDGQRYMVMEFLEGETLLERTLRSERLTAKELTPIALQIAEGLGKVHEAGIIHRDLKPGNIFLARTVAGEDFVKILDFGICKFREARGETTALGSLLGTLLYMAPEQLEHGSKALDARADIYSLGVILFRCISGRFPYDAKNAVDLQLQMRAGRPPSLAEIMPDVDKEFAAIVDKATEWDPRARYSAAEQMQADLAEWIERSHRRDLILSDFLGAPPPEPRMPSVVPRRHSSMAFAAPAAPKTERSPTPHPATQEPTDVEIDIVVDGPTAPGAS